MGDLILVGFNWMKSPGHMYTTPSPSGISLPSLPSGHVALSSTFKITGTHQSTLTSHPGETVSLGEFHGRDPRGG